MADITKVTLAKEKDSGIEYYYPSSSSDIIDHQIKDTLTHMSVKEVLDNLEDKIGSFNIEDIQEFINSYNPNNNRKVAIVGGSSSLVYSGSIAAKFKVADGTLENNEKLSLIFSVLYTSGSNNGTSTAILMLSACNNNGTLHSTLDILSSNMPIGNDNSFKLSINENKWELYFYLTYGYNPNYKILFEVISEFGNNVKDANYTLYSNLETSNISGTIINARELQYPYGRKAGTAVGVNSIAMGNNNTASGYSAFAVGNGNESTSSASMSMGNYNTASGPLAFAVGLRNTASGDTSICMGGENSSSGLYSVSIGFNNNNNGYSKGLLLGSQNSNTTSFYGIGIGNSNIVSGYSDCMALGFGNTCKDAIVIGSGNTGTGYNSTCIGGYNNNASKESIAIGYGNELHAYTGSITGYSYEYNFSFGCNNEINALNSISLGYDNEISNGQYNTIIGGCNNTIDGGYYSIVGGSNNTSNSGIALGLSNSASCSTYISVGIGCENTVEIDNAFAAGCYNNIKKQDEGNFYTYDSRIAIGSTNTINSYHCHAIGAYNICDNCKSSAFGYYNKTSGSRSIAIGCGEKYFNSDIKYNLVSGNNSIGIGIESELSGDNSVIIGSKNKASKEYSAIIGYGCNVIGDKGFAAGYECTADENSIAIGSGNTAETNYSCAIGYDNDINGQNTFILGHDNDISNSCSYIIGDNNKINADSTLIIGINNTYDSTVNTTNNNSSIAIGVNNNYINGNGHIKIGSNNTGSGNITLGNKNDGSGITIGDRNSGSGIIIGDGNSGSDITIGNRNRGRGISIGTENSGSSFGTNNSVYAEIGSISMALGYHNNISDNNSYTFGYNNKTSNSSIAIGIGNTGTPREVTDPNSGVTSTEWGGVGDNSIAMGNNNTLYDNTSIAIGKKNYCIKEHAITIGNSNTSDGNYAIIFGDSSRSNGDYSLAIGIENLSYAESSNTIGYNNNAWGKYSIALGSLNYCNTLVGGKGTIAIGYDNKADANYSISLGSSNEAEHNNAISIGVSNKSNSNNSIQIGTLCNTDDVSISDNGKFSSAIAIGYWAYANAQGAAAIGTAIKNYNAGSFACGIANKRRSSDERTSIRQDTDGDVFTVGNGYYDDTYASGFSFYTQNAFRVATNGTTYANGSYNSTGADYAEFVKEWYDGNPDNEDRVGYMVTIKNGKLYKANEGDYIIGITSGNPSVIGNGDEEYYWKFERDKFNRIILETVEIDIPKFDNDGNQLLDEDNNLITEKSVVTRRKVSSDYDSSMEYIERSKRPEWDYVGMRGIVPCRDDGTCEEGGFCKCGNNGIATKAEIRGFDTYYVIERIDEETISVEVR